MDWKENEWVSRGLKTRFKMNQDELDELFITVRDGELAEAREALEKADMSWLHSAFRQNMLFFVAARRRGCELLAKDCIRKGVDLAQIDSQRQTPLFWAAAQGNLPMVKFCLGLGMDFRDNCRKTALLFATLDVQAVDRTKPR